MHKSNDLAKNLDNLFKENSYREFGTGEFVHHPYMTGYYYIFKNITDPYFCILLNTSETPYPKDSAKIGEYVFIVFNIPSLEGYLENLATNYLDTILTKISENIQKKNPRNLPYGYYTDENGEIKVDLQKANEVRKIYDRYIDTQSVRQIVREMKSNFSHIRNVLHANEEYAQMREMIVPPTKLKQVNTLLAQNVKGLYRKRTTEDEIEELRKRRKEKKRMAELAG